MKYVKRGRKLDEREREKESLCVLVLGVWRCRVFGLLLASLVVGNRGIDMA